MTTKELADQLETRGTVPECFVGVLIGITEVEREQIVRALRAVYGRPEFCNFCNPRPLST